jgi:hypothetical protein
MSEHAGRERKRERNGGHLRNENERRYCRHRREQHTCLRGVCAPLDLHTSHHNLHVSRLPTQRALLHAIYHHAPSQLLKYNWAPRVNGAGLQLEE